MEDKSNPKLNPDWKQKLAEQELSDVLGPGILALEPEETQTNFVELPQLESVSDSQSNTTVNNLNVNVNVNGNQATNQNVLKTEVNNVIKNALPTVSASPDDLKKNLSEVLKPDLEESSNKQQLLEGLLESPDLIQSTSEYADNTFIPTLDLAGLDVFQQENLSEYTYTSSKLKESNPKLRQSYEILQNVISHSISNQEALTISPYSSLDVAYSTAGSVNNNFFVENLEVEQNKNNMLSEVVEMSKRSAVQEQNTQQQKVRSINQLTSKNKEEMIQEDLADAVIINPKDGNMMARVNETTPKLMKHLNPTQSTISLLTSKMNSPPNWRTVLG